MSDPTRAPRRWRRLLLKALGVLVVLLVASVAALPWAAKLSAVRERAVGKINAVLAPSRVEIRSIGLSWFGSTTVGGLVVRDPKGKAVFQAETLRLDRSLTDLIRDRSNLGTLTITGAIVDVERRADGSIDLLDILPRPSGPAPPPQSSPGPPTTIAVKIVAGTLKARAPELPDGLSAERLDAEVTLPADGPIRIAATLANPTRGESLELLGAIGAGIEPSSPPGLDASLKGVRWPWAIDAAGIVTRGRLDGKAEIRRRGESATLKGDVRLLDLVSSGPTLSGDQIRLAEVKGGWEAELRDGVWSARRILLESPIGIVDGSGSWPPSPAGMTRVTANVDLAAISKQAPHFLRLHDGLSIDRGSIQLSIRTAEAVGGVQPLEIEAKVSEIVAKDAGKTISLQEPANLSALILLGKTDFEVERLKLKTGFLDLSGSGGSDAGIKAVIDVDLAGLERQLRDLVDFGSMGLAGRGRLAATLRNEGAEFSARLGGELLGLRVAGLLERPVETDALKVDAELKGPIGGGGTPADWSTIHLGLKSAEGWLNADALRPEGKIAVGMSVSCPLPPLGPEARTDSRLIFHWSDPLVEIVDLHLGVKPSLARPETAISGRGRFDRAKGELVLSPPAKDEANDTVVILGDGLRVSGLNGPASGMAVEANLSGNLGPLDQALAGWTGAPPLDLGGKVQALLELGPEAGRSGRKVGITVVGSDLVRSANDPENRSAEGSIGLEIKGRWDAAGLGLETFQLGSRYGTLAATGRLTDPLGARSADLKGVIGPNWETIGAILDASIEPGTILTGSPRAFRVRGPLTATGLAALLAGLDGEVGLELSGIKMMGIKVGPAPIVFRCANGGWSIDPIRTTVNGGEANLMPVLAIDDSAGATLSLRPDSAIRNVAIDGDVARSILSYIAPVLVDATDVSGKVSASFDRCEIPLWGGPVDRSARVDGHVVFDDVTFGPGALAGEIADFAAPGRVPRDHLREVLALSIADRRVSQSGLSIPLGVGGSVDIAGSVGFDQSLALRAEVPLPTDRIARKVGLDGGKGPTKFPVEIGGTLTRPSVDRRAVARALEKSGRRAIESQAQKLPADVLRRLGVADRPGGPDLRGLLDELGRKKSGTAPR